jgi:hypothetical protein
MKRHQTETSNTDNPIIYINAGGTIIQTRLDTLTKNYPDSTLANMFKTVYLSDNDDKEPIFIDTDSKIFSYIIQYIRRNMDFSIVPKNVDTEMWYTEVDYWNLPLRCNTLNLHRELYKKKMMENHCFYESLLYEAAGEDFLKKSIEKGYNGFTLFFPDNEDHKITWGNKTTPMNVYIKHTCPFKMKYLGNYIHLKYRDNYKPDSSLDYNFKGKKYNTKNTKTLRITVRPYETNILDKIL